MKKTFLLCLIFCAIGLNAAPRPNIIVILSDDMGFSDIGCYGSEISTPNLDRLAGNGLRFTQFYNTARCCPTRASLLTGLYPHQAGVGHMTAPRGLEGYQGELNGHCVTIAESLKPAGYRTYAVGKWHVSRNAKSDGLKHNWPLQRGFDRYYGTITGAGNYFDPGTLTRDNTQISAMADPEYKPAKYYYTDAIADHATRFVSEHQRDHAAEPFFMYVAFTAAHWPLHAKPQDIAKYQGKYDAGYEAIRQARFANEKRLGLIDANWKLSPMAGDWSSVSNKAWEARCMEVYAAQIDCMDQGIGRLVAELQKQNLIENTLIFFLQDNGGCAEPIGRSGRTNRLDKPTFPPIPADAVTFGVRPKQTRAGYPLLSGPNIMPGPEDTFIAYGKSWANVSDTPFREYKHWVHEGGISTPLIAHWPKGIAARGELRRQPGHLIDIMATCLDVAGAQYPAQRSGVATTPFEGKSLTPAFDNQPIARDAIYWEHEGNRAVRSGNWKLVAKSPAGKWELYDMEKDRTEMDDLASAEPERVKQLSAAWETWARRAHVLPWIWKPQYGKSAGSTIAKDDPEVDETLMAGKNNFTLQAGDDLPRESAPQIGQRALSISAEILELAPDGVIIAQGGLREGVSLYLKNGKAHFATRRSGKLSVVSSPAELRNAPVKLAARLASDGTATLTVDGQPPASTKTAGTLLNTPIDGLQIGRDEKGAVGDYEGPFEFRGRIGAVVVELE